MDENIYPLTQRGASLRLQNYPFVLVPYELQRCVIKVERTTYQKQFRAADCKAKCTYRRLPSLRTCVCVCGIRDGRGVSSEGRKSVCRTYIPSRLSFETEKRRFRSLWAPILTGFRVRRRHLGRVIKTKPNPTLRTTAKVKAKLLWVYHITYLPIGKLIFDWMCWF